jgi:hypothetical protein
VTAWDFSGMATCYVTRTADLARSGRSHLMQSLFRNVFVDQLHIIFIDEQVVVSKKAYVSWREMQAEFDGYKASLGPWNATTTMSWLEEEYDLVPSAEEQVRSLVSSDEAVRTLSFATK